MTKEFPMPNTPTTGCDSGVETELVIRHRSFFSHYDLEIRNFPAWWRLPSVLAFCSAFLYLAASIACAAPNDAQFNQWIEVQTNLQSWSGDFTQTRTLKVLNQPLVSTGKVWVTHDAFRWELGQPVQTVVLRQPDQLLIIYPRLKQAEKYPLGAVPSGPIKAALALLDATLPRDR